MYVGFRYCSNKNLKPPLVLSLVWYAHTCESGMKEDRPRCSKQKPVIVHKVTQGNGFKHAIQRSLEAFPGLAHFAGVKA